MREELEKTYDDTIYQETKTKVVYSQIPPEKQFNKVLFIEKRGFTSMLNESGVLDGFNMAPISTAGYAGRVAKKLINYFISRGIKCYVLHDCDIFGYNIHARIEGGGRTFTYPLDVIDIGLTVNDVSNLGLEFEKVEHTFDYSAMLTSFGNDALEFFMPNREPITVLM